VGKKKLCVSARPLGSEAGRCPQTDSDPIFDFKADLLRRWFAKKRGRGDGKEKVLFPGIR